MGIISDVKDGFSLVRNARKTKRSFSEFLAMLQNSSTNQQPDFLDGNYPSYLSLPQTQASFIGTTDVAYGVSPKEMFEMFNRDTYVTGLFDTLIETLFKNDFFVDVLKDANGKDLGSKAQALRYGDQLKEIGFERLVIRQIFAERGDGGGNALLFTVRTLHGIEFKVEPFIYNGRPRVKVYADLHSQKILKYEVLDERMEVVYTLDPNINYLYHLRYSPSGDFRFSNNPAKRAVYWYVLKKYLAGANLARFKNGLQDPIISTPDYSALKDLMGAMSNGSKGLVSGNSIPDYLKDPLSFLAKQGLIDDELFRQITGRADKTNMMLRLSFPQKIERIGISNVQMQVTELISLCDKQMGYAYRTSEGLLNTQNSKFSNAEMERDNWSDLVVDPIKRKIEKIGEEFYLPVLDSEFDRTKYRLRFGRSVEQEDIDQFNAKTQRNTSKAQILLDLSGIPDIAKYNFETNEIEPVINPNITNKENAKQPDYTNDNDAIVNDKENERKKLKRARKVSISHIAIISPEGRKFNGIVKNSINKQLRAYTSKLGTYNSLLKAHKSLDKDLRSITNFGLSVNTYKQQLLKVSKFGLDEYKKTVGKKRLFLRADGTLDYPQSILDLLDAKSQLMVKGYDSLNSDQKDLIKLFYRNPEQNRSMTTYQGLDSETSDQLNTIIQNALDNSDSMNPPLVEDIVNQINDEIDGLSEGRATRIVNTEIAQSVQATRYNLYLGDGNFDEKSWANSGDDIVRQSHRENTADGWIGIDEAFTGDDSYTPADAINCRCDLIFRNSLDDNSDNYSGE